MEIYSVALFGEAEKGEFRKPYFCRTLSQLVEYLGNPPAESAGLYYAVQALLYDRNLIFFRVEQEGFSQLDYLQGFRLLEDRDIIQQLAAICMPGVGDIEIIKATQPVCKLHHSILITTESDLYDFLTEKAA